MLLHQLLDAVDVLELRGDPRTEVASLTFDSRRVAPGGLFCCVPGSRADGHDHAPAAVAAGATALLVERLLDLPPGPGVSPTTPAQVRVGSVRAAMAPVAAAFFGHPSRRMRVLGVTGTNGKTTTTYLLEAIVRTAGLRAGVVGTVETRIDGVALPGERTTPEAPDLQGLFARMVDAGVDVAAVEVSSHALALHRADATWFAAACFTNLSHDHLDFHDDIETYFEAKATLFDPARTAAAAVNLDDTHGALLAARCAERGIPLTTFGRAGADASVRAEAVELTAVGSRFRLATPAGTVAVHSPLVGRFNVENALAAAATALAAGLPLEAVVTGLSVPLVVPGRMEPIDSGQPFPVLVDYAHSPDGLEQVLRAARGLVEPGVRGVPGSAGRLVVVFGAGGDRDRAKRPAMGKVAATLADSVWITSDNPRSEDPFTIAQEVARGVHDVGGYLGLVLDRRGAIRAAMHDLREGDVLVIAGKGHETGQTAMGITTPFDDRDVAREELARLGWGDGPECA
ncbi:MAG TPA: UDP-N-acetylmuramoyl-L-alanyl-D-glutamate--2,6-diaminopimelate ligase [Acidimicrobiia bacterium]